MAGFVSAQIGQIPGSPAEGRRGSPRDDEYKPACNLTRDWYAKIYHFHCSREEVAILGTVKTPFLCQSAGPLPSLNSTLRRETSVYKKLRLFHRKTPIHRKGLFRNEDKKDKQTGNRQLVSHWVAFQRVLSKALLPPCLSHFLPDPSAPVSK